MLPVKPSLFLVAFLFASSVLYTYMSAHSSNYNLALSQPFSATSNLSSQTTGVTLPASTSSTIYTTSSTTATALSVSSIPTSLSIPQAITSTTRSPIIPTPTVDPATVYTFQLITSRRISTIIDELSSGASVTDIANWLSTLGSNGQWPDSEINYTTGCDAQKANWPAQVHWARISLMAGAWYGGMDTSWVGNATLRDAISLAMRFWFENDITNLDCLDSGGETTCPCGTPGFWSTNWFSNIILIPSYLSQTCLLLNTTLSATELSNCTSVLVRSYGTIDKSYGTGANILDIATIGIDQGLLIHNTSMLIDAFRRIHNEVSIKQDIAADGIRPDGGFGQHSGLMYNGNYGYIYINDAIDLELEVAETEYEANSTARVALETVFDGNRWTIFMNSLTGVLHWDYSILPRFISFPVIDNQATSGIRINLTKVETLGERWDSYSLKTFTRSLQENVSNANAGNLVGNKVFFNNDYMVHRGEDYVSTLKMFSSRTRNSECTNKENPYGFHLSDGARYTFMSGNEYEDIFAAWDWNLIPGITTDYDHTRLDCDHVKFQGIQSFVGGVSTGTIGVGVMRYTNPQTLSLSFQKAWFFLPGDMEHVMVGNVSSASTAPVISVLDQKRRNGDIYVGPTSVTTTNSRVRTFDNATTLWHDSVGYLFNMNPSVFSLNIKTGDEVGNWSALGISTQPTEIVDLFAAWIEHQEPVGTALSYTMYPSISHSSFISKVKVGTGIQEVQNDAHVSAIYEASHGIAMFIFWDQSGGQVSFSPISIGGVETPSPHITVSASESFVVILDMWTGNVTVSDPSQRLDSVSVVVDVDVGLPVAGNSVIPSFWSLSGRKTLTYILPQSGLAGSSVSQSLF